MKNKFAVGIGVLLLIIVVYYTAVVLIARAETEEIVVTALSSDKIKLRLDDLTDEQLEALLKVQDPGFYSHQGFDFETPGTGVTTLSQGLVKMYYFDNFKPGIGKVKQTLIARFAFDPLTPKDTTLLLFINEVYLGEKGGAPLKGFEDGAQFYFHKNFRQLTWDEYLSLIAMIRAPFNYHYFSKREANLERVGRIRKLLSGEYTPKDNSDIFYDRE
ncbi:transglycosylase domain-containing protein [Pontibacter cellulosilyticus]|uniref:Transglycosylase domain-containing protein n=1 Tax=Pontibacter cellulosilyticus TaxID=1720253 RepID=A0A923N6I8_9BACT|nr:transglycosylase domain-containing protein [Pontibacter cellulosilyticus]MBC5992356.1 transglycosylase domain-containing protein [Pontibacter cellulosilyticus]